MSAGDLAVEHGNKAALREYGKAEQLVVNQRGISLDRRAEMLYWYASH